MFLVSLLVIYFMHKENRIRFIFFNVNFNKILPSITAPPENVTRHEEHKEESVADVYEASYVSCSPQLDSIEKLETADLVAQYQMFLNKEEEVLAATRIQTAFRGYLVRSCTLLSHVIPEKKDSFS